MGSGGSQTLWPPSNEAGVFGLIDALSVFDERIRLEDPPIADSRAVVDGGILQARTELLGPVSSTHYCASTPGLST